MPRGFVADIEVIEKPALREDGKAEVTIAAHAEKFALLDSLGEDLKYILITSQAQASEVSDVAAEAIVVTASTAQKCERCWHYRADVGSHAAHPGLCSRCESNLFGAGVARKFV